MDPRIVSELLREANTPVSRMGDESLHQYIRQYMQAYGADSTGQVPAPLRFLARGMGGKALLGTLDTGEPITRPTTMFSNTITPEMPEVAQQMARVLAELKLRRR